jgi:broad specificity phosphatase PhoE
MTTSTVLLVRHAESVWNVEDRYQGQFDSGLTDIGREQSEVLSVWLQRSVGKADLILSSDLPRVVATAEPFARATGAKVLTDRRLREVDVGSWSGRTFQNVAGAEPQTVAAADAGHDVRRGGGETFAEVRTRAIEAIAEATALTAAGSTVIVFTHGGPIRVVAAHAVGVPAPGHVGFGAPDNCSVTTIQLRGGRGVLRRYNEPVVAVERETRTL